MPTQSDEKPIQRYRFVSPKLMMWCVLTQRGRKSRFSLFPPYHFFYFPIYYFSPCIVLIIHVKKEEMSNSVRVTTCGRRIPDANNQACVDM
jgi:hypothetical protein